MQSMKKEPSIQKKKTPLTTFLNILYKVLIGIAVVIFGYIIFNKVDFSSSQMSFSSKKKENRNSHTPGKLKWFDDFKGVENVPDKKDKQSGNSGNTGFRYEGFKK